VFQFLLGRLQNHWSGEFSTFEIQMALGRASGDLLDVEDRLKALQKLRGSSELLEAAGAFKRIENILQQARDKGIAAVGFEPRALAEEAEKALAATYEKARAQVGDSIKSGDYAHAFE